MMHRARKRGLISGVSLPHSILLFPRSHREITLNQTRPHSRLDTATKPAVARCCEWYHDRVCILFSTTIPVDPLNPATDKRHAERVITWPTRRGWGPSEKWHRPARNNPSNEISYGFPLSFFFFLTAPESRKFRRSSVRYTRAPAFVTVQFRLIRVMHFAIGERVSK